MLPPRDRIHANGNTTTNCKAVQTHAPGGPVKSSNISNGTFWVQGMAWDVLPGNWPGQCAPIFISDHTFKITMDATSTSTSTTRKRRSTPDLKQHDSIWGSDVPEEFKLWTERHKVLNASCKFNEIQEIDALRIAVMQHRVALDIILAEKGEFSLTTHVAHTFQIMCTHRT
ncbi:unnamed protein product [Oreochromis niloticus]|nr:unnamed protein product [Mustela putorius furo]